MKEEKIGRSSGLSVGVLVTAIIAFLIAVIPCMGLIAFIPAIVAIVLAIVGLSRPERDRGTIIGGLVVAIVALMISLSQFYVIGKVVNQKGSWANNIEKVIREVTDDLEREFGDKEVTIRISDKEDSVEIRASVKKGDLLERLEELEGVTDTVKEVTPGKTPEGQ